MQTTFSSILADLGVRMRLGGGAGGALSWRVPAKRRRHAPLPSRFAAVILAFAPLFLQRSWRHAEALLTGAILAPGGRTVASVLRITGLAQGGGS